MTEVMICWKKLGISLSAIRKASQSRFGTKTLQLSIIIVLSSFSSLIHQMLSLFLRWFYEIFSFLSPIDLR